MNSAARLPALLGAILFVVLAPAVLGAQTLRIYQVDVEQADAALLVMPNGKTLLIDSGKNGHGQRIREVMKQAGVSQIDAFVNSHYHEDHFGGIDDLVDAGVPVLESFDRGDKACCLSAAKKAETAFKDYLRTVGEDAHALRAGGVIELDPLVNIQAISSGGVVSGEAPPVTAGDENDMSVSLLVSFQGFTAFYGGDIEAPTETKIAARDVVMDVDLYKASHHGSNTSSAPALMTDLRPSVIVISNGSHGGFKHPRQVSLNTYAGLAGPPTVFQTNKCLQPAPCGNVADGQIADPEQVDVDGTILITVSGGTYTVAYGSTSRSFSVKHPVLAAPPSSASGVVIVSLLPNPSGDDTQLETVTLQNRGGSSVSLLGWTLRDRSGLTWNLSGPLNAGETRVFQRNGQAMSLNNAGDEIVLVDASNAERDRFAYSSSVEGTAIDTQH